MAYGMDLRRRVVSFVRKGGTRAEAAKRFDVNLRTVYRWLGRGDDIGARKPGPRGAFKIDMKKLAAMVGEDGTDMMLREIAKQLGVHESSVSKAMKKLGVSRKKNHAL